MYGGGAGNHIDVYLIEYKRFNDDSFSAYTQRYTQTKVPVFYFSGLKDIFFSGKGKRKDPDGLKNKPGSPKATRSFHLVAGRGDAFRLRWAGRNQGRLGRCLYFSGVLSLTCVPGRPIDKPNRVHLSTTNHRRSGCNIFVLWWEGRRRKGG
jgi:hypothetical protein